MKLSFATPVQIIPIPPTQQTLDVTQGNINLDTGVMVFGIGPGVPPFQVTLPPATLLDVQNAIRAQAALITGVVAT